MVATPRDEVKLSLIQSSRQCTRKIVDGDSYWVPNIGLKGTMFRKIAVMIDRRGVDGVDKGDEK